MFIHERAVIISVSIDSTRFCFKTVVENSRRRRSERDEAFLRIARSDATSILQLCAPGQQPLRIVRTHARHSERDEAFLRIA